MENDVLNIGKKKNIKIFEKRSSFILNFFTGMFFLDIIILENHFK